MLITSKALVPIFGCHSQVGFKQRQVESSAANSPYLNDITQTTFFVIGAKWLIPIERLSDSRDYSNWIAADCE